MKRIHLSAQKYTRAYHAPYTPTPDVRPDVDPTPACGYKDTIHNAHSTETRHVAMRGEGEGIIHYRAMSPEWHCAACVERVRNEVYGQGQGPVGDGR